MRIGRSVLALSAGFAISAGAQSQMPRPIDTSTTLLPIGVRPSPVRDVFNLFRIKPKGEFETTAEFTARAPLVPPGFFVVACLDEGESSISYDADSARFLISPAMANGVVTTQEGVGANGTYLLVAGSPADSLTAYGVRMASVVGGSHLRFSYPMSRDSARAAKGRLRTVAVVRLSQPPIPSARQDWGAALVAIRAADLWLWLYDASTNRILAKWDLGTAARALARADSVADGRR